jgi:hypothetical protein
MSARVRDVMTTAEHAGRADQVIAVGHKHLE